MDQTRDSDQFQLQYYIGSAISMILPVDQETKKMIDGAVEEIVRGILSKKGPSNETELTETAWMASGYFSDRLRKRLLDENARILGLISSEMRNNQRFSFQEREQILLEQEQPHTRQVTPQTRTISFRLQKSNESQNTPQQGSLSLTESLLDNEKVSPAPFQFDFGQYKPPILKGNQKVSQLPDSPIAPRGMPRKFIQGFSREDESLLLTPDHRYPHQPIGKERENQRQKIKLTTRKRKDLG